MGVWAITVSQKRWNGPVMTGVSDQESDCGMAGRRPMLCYGGALLMRARGVGLDLGLMVGVGLALGVKVGVRLVLGVKVRVCVGLDTTWQNGSCQRRLALSAVRNASAEGIGSSVKDRQSSMKESGAGATAAAFHNSGARAPVPPCPTLQGCTYTWACLVMPASTRFVCRVHRCSNRRHRLKQQLARTDRAQRRGSWLVPLRLHFTTVAGTRLSHPTGLHINAGVSFAHKRGRVCVMLIHVTSAGYLHMVMFRHIAY